MKTLLIDPPRFDSIYGGTIGKKIPPTAPPLGLLYIAAVALENNFEVKILEAYGNEMSCNEISKETSCFNPDVIGITCTTVTFKNALTVCETLKKSCPNALIVMGGSHVSSHGEAERTLSKHELIDICILGEGEYSFLEILQGKPLEDIGGIVFRKNGTVFKTSPRPAIENIDSIPFPARHLININNYVNPIYDVYSAQMTSIISSRGCPFKCTFCGSQNVFGHTARFRSIENVIEEIDIMISRHGVKGLHFRDDTFTLKPSRLEKLCVEIEKRDLKWTGNMRADSYISKDLLKMMKKSGCCLLLIGVESGDKEVLKSWRKETNIENLRKVFKWTREVGIDTHASYIIGAEKETRGSVDRTIEFAKETNPDVATFFILIPFPARHLININNYVNPIYDVYSAQMTSIISSRGCPLKCACLKSFSSSPLSKLG